MKTRLTLLTLLFTATCAMGQIVSYISSLKTSESGITVAELSLVHRSRTNYNDIRDLGSRVVMIPKEFQGQKFKIESYRFKTYSLSSFEMDGITYIPVSLYYDSETIDPRDDIYILSIPFPVGTELVIEELSYYEGEELDTATFRIAPKGDSKQAVKKVKVIKLETD